MTILKVHISTTIYDPLLVKNVTLHNGLNSHAIHPHENVANHIRNCKEYL